MDQKITIKEIAEHCGVSLATVSRALNGNSYVSAGLRKKIYDYVEDIGWNAKKSTVMRSSLGSDVVVVASLTLLDSEDETLKRLLAKLHDSGFNPITLLGPRSKSLQRCLQEHPPVVVLCGLSDRLHEQVKMLIQSGIRVIGIGEALHPPCPLVVSEHRTAAREVAKKLRKNGASQIALFAGMGAQPHPNNLEKIYSVPAKMIQGIQEVYPNFDFTRDAVSDCFGDLTEFVKMLDSGRYDGWIMGNTDRLNEMIRLRGVAYALASHVALLTNTTRPVPPVCQHLLIEDVATQIDKLIELIQKPAECSKMEFLIPYFGLTPERQKRNPKVTPEN